MAQNRNSGFQKPAKDMKPSLKTEDWVICCPECRSEAVYRYGKTKAGKQRFLCLLCGRQFSFGSQKSDMKRRPACPVCKSPMHVYRREIGAVRLRCSRYPNCKTFLKIEIEEQNQ
jgi:uncharacterized protein YbaR (Trm112 family)